MEALFSCGMICIDKGIQIIDIDKEAKRHELGKEQIIIYSTDKISIKYRLAIDKVSIRYR